MIDNSSPKSHTRFNSAHFYWTSVYYTLPVLKTLCYGVLGHNRLTSASMCGNQYALVPLDSIHRNLLKRIQSKLILPSRFRGWYMAGNWCIAVSWWNSHLVPNLWLMRKCKLTYSKYIPGVSTLAANQPQQGRLNRRWLPSPALLQSENHQPPPERERNRGAALVVYRNCQQLLHSLFLEFVHSTRPQCPVCAFVQQVMEGAAGSNLVCHPR